MILKLCRKDVCFCFVDIFGKNIVPKFLIHLEFRKVHQKNRKNHCKNKNDNIFFLSFVIFEKVLEQNRFYNLDFLSTGNCRFLICKLQNVLDFWNELFSAAKRKHGSNKRSNFYVGS